MSDAALALEDVAKVFPSGGGLRGLTLAARKGEISVVVGPSGCGKTTALRIAAGLHVPDRGRVLVAGRDVTRLPPEKRGLGVVFQHYALFPHLTAENNVAYGLRARGVGGGELRAKVAAALALVGLAEKGARRLDALSGGEQQRVAVARALAFEPPVLLLDEPLSNLDLALRRKTREELTALVRRLGLAALHVTHDQEEALAVADRLFVLENGRLAQEGPPEDVYARPASAFVARFLGGASVVRARRASAGMAEIAPGVVLPCAPDGPVGELVDLVLRPERLTLGAPAPGAAAARVVARTFVGGDVVCALDLAGASLEVRLRSFEPGARAAVGDAVLVGSAAPAHAMKPGTAT